MYTTHIYKFGLHLKSSSHTSNTYIVSICHADCTSCGEFTAVSYLYIHCSRFKTLL